MSESQSLCALCAARQRTCCQFRDIYVTLGDVARIREQRGADGFWEFRVPDDPDYLDSDDDPLWHSRVARPDRARRVLKRRSNGDCAFLQPTGCCLPMEARPLVCRLHPLQYNQYGIDPEPAAECPWHLLPGGKPLLAAVRVVPSDAQRWHGQLYREILDEPEWLPEKAGCPLSTESLSLPLPSLHACHERPPLPMKIGLTYDLRSDYLALGFSELETAEFDRPDTIDAIEGALLELGFETDRIGHARQLVQRLAAGDRWDLVFNICEGLRGPARESQVPALLDVYQIPYTFSDPLVLAVCLEKGMTKTLLAAAGVPTAPFAVARHLGHLPELAFDFPVFAKPIAEGTGKGITPASRVETPEDLAAVCGSLLREHGQPVLLEPFLPGREFTVGIWGTGPAAEVIGTLEIALRDHAEPGVYSYVNKEQCEQLVDYRPVRPNDDQAVGQAEAAALQAWRALDCRDAGRVDLRCDRQGRVQVMEINPLAGLHPEHSDLPMICTAEGIPYVRLIERIVRSALERCLSAAPPLSAAATMPDESPACA